MTQSLPNKEFLFYYESRQNPNGDPGFENQPRLMPDDTILVTDVRLKRTVRDYARDRKGMVLFVDYGKNGEAVQADERARELVGNLERKDVILELIKKTFDVPLFGALVTIRSNKSSGRGDSHKLTGPVQLALARSVNKVKIVNPTIVGRFVGKKKEGDAQHSTFGKFYSVEYALIKAPGAVSPRNLGEYSENPEAINSFASAETLFCDCLWNGTNFLVTRSKYPQRSVFYLEVAYKPQYLFNDLAGLVGESESLKGWAKSLPESPFDFSRFLTAVDRRRAQIQGIRMAHCEELGSDIHNLKTSLESKGMDVDDVSCTD